ncbi:MAG: murein biosynthesis integral membrane protein MurJ [Acidobacteria bacterium]|nr:murein biosynthesis integral membrane protein MurJ [Acidobacteriota bacterium]
MKARASLLRSASIVGAMTLLSRLSGLAQTFFLSHVLGAGAAADAYAVAFRLPNLLRRFTAEGTMTAAFLPTLAEVEAKEGEAAMKETAAKFLGTLTVLLAILVTIAILLMGIIAGLLVVGRLTPPGSGFGASFAMLGKVLTGQVPPPPEMALTVKLGRIMFPYLVLVSLTAGFAGLLNLRHRFGLAASVGIFFNLGFIGAGALGIGWFKRAGHADASTAAFCCGLAVLAGGALQLAVLWPAARRMGFRFKPGLHFRDPGVKRALRRMGPGLVAAGIYPINALISTLLASKLADGAQIILFNSGMMGEMVLGLFAMSLATASLPLMAQQAEAGDLDGLRSSLSDGLRASALLCIPACVGLAVLSLPVARLLFQTGRYGADAAAWTADTMVFQMVGLLFVASSRIGTQALYALKDYRGPVLIAFASLLANIALSIALLRPMGTSGLALANGLSAILGLALLTRLLRRRVERLPARPVLKSWGQSLAGAALMGLIAFLGLKLLHLDGPLVSRRVLALKLFPLIAICGAAYFAFMLALGNTQAKQLAAKVRQKLAG